MGVGPMSRIERDGRSGGAAAWTPDLKRWGKPHYLAIVEALADDIRSGRLLKIYLKLLLHLHYSLFLLQVSLF